MCQEICIPLQKLVESITVRILQTKLIFDKENKEESVTRIKK